MNGEREMRSSDIDPQLSKAAASVQKTRRSIVARSDHVIYMLERKYIACQLRAMQLKEISVCKSEVGMAAVGAKSTGLDRKSLKDTEEINVSAAW